MKHPDDIVSYAGREFFDRLPEDEKDKLLLYGHIVLCVFTADNLFFYTKGRSLFGLPEIFVTGPLGVDNGMALVNTLASLDDRGEINVREAEDKLVSHKELGNKWKCLPVNAEACEMFQAIYFARHFEAEIEAVQLMWPDINGYYPDEMGYSLQPTVQPAGHAPVDVA